MTDPGVGSYWTVNLNAPPGTKRPRKRGKKDPVEEAEALPPRKRGRPRKYPEQEPMIFDQAPISLSMLPAGDGCPPSGQLPTWSTREGSSGKSGEGDSNFDDDEGMMGYNEIVDTLSGEDYESEEDQGQVSQYVLRQIPHPPARVRNHAHPPPQQTHHQQTHQHYVHPTRAPEINVTSSRSNYGGHDAHDNPDRLIERLRNEVEGLRQQSADAVSTSVKMADQLAEAHAEATRVRAALRTLETKYDEAEKRRKEAERAADQQSRMRHAAEETLRGLEWRSRSISELEED